MWLNELWRRWLGRIFRQHRRQRRLPRRPRTRLVFEILEDRTLPSSVITNTMLTSSADPAAPGQALTFTATVATVSPSGPVNAGTVQFLIDGVNFGAPVSVNSSGVAVSNATTQLSLGRHLIVADYSGTSTFDSSAQSYSDSVLSNSPTAYYPLNETSGTTAQDTSGNGANATYSGGATFGVPGPIPGTTAVQLDGSTGSISLPAAPFGNYPTSGSTTNYALSFEVWFKAAAGSQGGVILGQTGGGFVPAVMLRTDGKIHSSLFWYGSVNGITSSSTYNDGNWHLLDATYGNGTQTLYIDNALIGSQSVSETAYASSYVYTLGTGTADGWPGGNGGSSFHFNGQLAQAAVYSSALSASQIAAHWSAAQSELTQAVAQVTTTTVTSSTNPAVFGQPLTFTATVAASGSSTGTPTGTVTFLDGGVSIGTGTLAGGTATFATSSLALGAHSITASYSGDNHFQVSSATAISQTINRAGTSTALTSSANPSVLGQSVTFTAKVAASAPSAGTPTGTVTFLDSGASIGTGTLSGGVATFSTSSLALGAHTITASYASDGNFQRSISLALGQTEANLASATAISNLIQQIDSANLASGPTTITLPADTIYDFTAADNSTDGGNALPVITANITIIGSGDALARTAGSPAFRLFEVMSSGSLTLQNVTLSGGLAQGTGTAAEGGAIFTAGTLNLSGVTVQGNEALGNAGAMGRPGGPGTSAYGGGLYVAGGVVTGSGDTISGDQAVGGAGGKGRFGNSGSNGGAGGNGGNGYGGGLYVATGTVTLNNENFNGNQALGGAAGHGGPTFGTRFVGRGHNGFGGVGGAGYGGGVYVATGAVTLSSNTLNSNQAGGGNAGGSGFGGGLEVAGGNVTLGSDTIKSNNAVGGAAGIATGQSSGFGSNGGVGQGGGLFAAGGAITLSNGTVSDNVARGGTAGEYTNAGSGYGGGLFAAGGAVTLSNEGIHGNQAVGGSGNNGDALAGGLFVGPGLTVVSTSTSISGNVVTAGSLGVTVFPDIASDYPDLINNIPWLGHYSIATEINTIVTVSSSASTSTYGEPITITATVSANPLSAGPVNTGTVQFWLNPYTPWGAPVSVNASGVATLPTMTNLAATAPYTDLITASYTDTSASSRFNASVGSMNQTINQANAPTIAATPYHVTYDGYAHTASATATGLFGETPTWSSFNLSGTTHTGAGVYTDSASYSDNLIVGTATEYGDYQGATFTVTDIIDPATPTVSVNPVSFTYGLALANKQLSGSATYTVAGSLVSVPGTFAYTGAAGTVLNVGNGQSIAVTFTPNDSVDYTTVSTTVTVNVAPAPSPFVATTTSQLINDILGATGPITIELQAADSTNGFDFTSAYSSTGDAMPTISTNVTITGTASFDNTIQRSSATGTPAFRLFEVTGGGSLTLENLTLTGGLAQGTGTAAEGGAIYNAGTLNLTGVTLQGNHAQGLGLSAANANGGGLYVAAGAVSLNNVVLQSNQAVGGTGGSGVVGGVGAGGGLYVAGGAVTMSQITLKSNKAVGPNGRNNPSSAIGAAGGAAAYGGGLYVAAGTVTLSNAILQGNQAVGGNGGFSGRHTRFNGGGRNGGVGGGGGLYVGGGAVTLNGDNFQSNQAAGGNGGGDDYTQAGSGGVGAGGGLYAAAGNVTLNGGIFNGNRAVGGSGGQAVFAHTVQSGQSYFGLPGNAGLGEGGGLYVAAGAVTLSHEKVQSNDAVGAGGTALDGYYNFAIVGSVGAGGGLYVAGGAVTLSNDTVQSNQAMGGNARSSGATSNGGGGAGTGGGLYVAAGAVTLGDDTLQGNQAVGGNADNGAAGAGSGGALNVAGGAVTLSGDTLQDNQAIGGSAQGRYISGAAGAGSGGGLFVTGGTVTLSDDTLSGNQAVGANGGHGGISESGGAGAAASGGGLYVAGGAVTVSNDILSGNRAVAGHGGYGGLFAAGGAGGTASGGGLNVAGGAVTFSNDTVQSNQAVGGYGGNGGYNAGGNAGGAGFAGGLYVAAGTVTLSNDTVQSNQAVGGNGGAGGRGAPGAASRGPGPGGSAGAAAGGGLYVAAGAVTLNNGALSGNKAVAGIGGAGGYGGAFWNGGNGGNGGNAAGGGLYVSPSVTVLGNGSSISSNTPTAGAGGSGGFVSTSRGLNPGSPGAVGTASFADVAANSSGLGDWAQGLTFQPTVSTTLDLIADVIIANNNGGPRSITLAPGASFAFSAANDFTAGASAMIVSGDITIVGNSDTIDRTTGSPAFRLFHVADSGSLTLENLTLTGGLAQGASAAAEGGAILSTGTLTLSGVTVQGNVAQGLNGVGYSGPGGNAYGGGVAVAGGSATLSNNTLSGNQAVGGNGGDGRQGVLFSGATGGGPAGSGFGGGLVVMGGTVTLSTNTIGNNIAQGGSGGNGGAAASANQQGGGGGSGGSGFGGGLYVAGGSVNLANETLSANIAVGGAGGAGGPGGSGGSFARNAGNGGPGGNSTGGGLYVAAGVSVLHDSASTLANNTVSAVAEGAGGLGYAPRNGSNGSAGAAGTASFADVAANSTGFGNYLFAPTLTTTIDNANGAPATGAVGESVYDAATVTGTAGAPTGSVTYCFYNTSTPIYGTTTPVSTQTVTLSGGSTPHSATTSALATGNYAYIAVYSGDSTYAPLVGAVEPLTISQSASITSAHTVNFTSGQANSFTVTTSGFPAPALTPTGRGALRRPTRQRFHDNGNGMATLSGTPSLGSGAYVIDITANNGYGAAALQVFTLNVQYPPTITSASSVTFKVGTAGSFTPAATAGFPTTTTITEAGTLPSGVTFTSGILSGTPAAGTGGSYPITFTAANSQSSSTQSFTLKVDQAPAITSAGAASFIENQAGTTLTIKTTGFPAPAISSGTLPAGLSLTDNHNGTATISGTATVSGSFNVTITASNGIGTNATQPLALTLATPPTITSANSATFKVGAAGSFTPAATAGFPATTTFSESGTLPSGVTFTSGKLSGTPAAGTGGTYPITFTASNGSASSTQSFTLTVDQAPGITSAATANFVENQAGTTFTIKTTGFPAPTFTSGAVYGGLWLTDNGDGTATISGTALETGSFNVTITAKNGIGTSATQTLAETLAAPPTITSANTTTFNVGTAGSFTPAARAASSATITLSETGKLPSGVTFTSGKLSGTPAAGSGGTYPITFTASNGSLTSTQNFTLTVDQAPAITSAAKATFIDGKAGSFTITTTDYPTPAHYFRGAACRAACRSPTITTALRRSAVRRPSTGRSMSL